MTFRLNALVVSSLIGAAGILPASAAAAGDALGKDPVRWTTEDTTPQARYRSARKEAGAALQEAITECKRAPGPDRAVCAKEARERFAQDMAEAKQLLAR